ncbi:Protein CsiD [Salmonella enterica subsp. enterica]|uniref:Protein CsiD n=1 Tax=Salmonella enterica I TaxID=59201 RepID=A0A447N596_SALET|nr:Protein CsiD [Salmonella enterica subsp. enterica]
MQALEYKSFLRFKIGKILDDLCGNQLQPLLIKTLLNRAQGALLISAEGIDDVAQAEEMVKLATAVAHLIGRSNYDAMSGQYYARSWSKTSTTPTVICASPPRNGTAQ